jgi:hypothetical protein
VVGGFRPVWFFARLSVGKAGRGVLNVVDDSSKSSSEVVVFSCAFWKDVKCSFRKKETFGIMNRCLKCPEYLRFMNAMQESDAKEDAEALESGR